MQIFTNSAIHASIIPQTIYECKQNEDCTIHTLLITNNSETESIKLTLQLEKNKDLFYCIPKKLELTPLTTLEMKPINLSPSDKLIISVDINDICDVVASILREVKDY